MPPQDQAQPKKKGFWGKFGKGMLTGLKHTGTTTWGAVTVGALLVNQHPEIVQAIAPQYAPIIGVVSGAVAAIAGLGTANAAADANKVVTKQQPPPGTPQ